MIYLWAFIFSGTICLISQVIYDNTKLCPGHITSILVSIGSILSSLGIYQKLVEICGGGATILITNFSCQLVKGMEAGMKEDGFIGIFTYSLSKTGAVLAGVVFISFIASLFCKSKH